MNKLPIYFSHGYRERETVYNQYFGKLIEQNGFIPSLDPPSGDVNSAKLEKHLRHTVGLIAIVTNRNGNISPYIRYEIDLAIRNGKPVLVYIEDNLPDTVTPSFILKRRFSTRSFYRDFNEHQHALTIFRSFVGENQLPKYQSLTYQKSAILLGFNKKLGLETQIKTYLTASGYAVWDKVEKEEEDLVVEGERHFYLSNAHLAVCLTDHLSSKGCYYLGAIRSVQIPAILLTQDKKPAPDTWIPDEFRKRYISPRNSNAFRFILTQIELFEEDFVEVDNEKKWETYVNALSSGTITRGEYSHEFREAIINHIYMGDKFENISGTVINRSVVTNSFNKISEQLDPESVALLKQITEEVDKSGNKEAVENMEAFHTEIQKPEPKKGILKSLWNGVTTAIPALITNTDKVVDIIEKIGKMIP
jgi:hypothetical protein